MFPAIPVNYNSIDSVHFVRGIDSAWGKGKSIYSQLHKTLPKSS